FCAGDDLTEFDLRTRDEGALEGHVARLQQVSQNLLLSPKLVIAAAHGYAVGGGFTWMLNCDLVVASEDLVAFFPEMEWGRFPTGGITHLLPLALGYQRAMQLLVLGERQSAARLAELGLVNWVVPRDELLPRAITVAEQVIGKSRFAVGRLKRVINAELTGALAHAQRLEQEATIQAFNRDEAAERVARFAARARG